MVLEGQRILDPEGVNIRKQRRLKRRLYRNPGPNYAIHVDGYDKLKPYGFAIHGAVDGQVHMKVLGKASIFDAGHI